MKKNKEENQLPNNISVDEILKDIDTKIQEIEAGKTSNEMTKTKIDGVDSKEIVKALEKECKILEKRENNND